MVMRLPKELRAKKLGEHGHPAKFLGEASSGYKAYDPMNHKVVIVRAPIFREEAKPLPNAMFEPPANDSDDDPIDTLTSTLLPTDDAILDPDASPSPPPSTSHTRPVHSQHAPPHFNPDDFSAHGHRKEAITNAFED